jgi:hypothetical protein
LRAHMAKRHRKLQPGTRPARNTDGHSGGHPGFVPTEAEKAFVAAMAGVRMTWDEICRVLGSARNGPDRGKRAGAPIAKTTYGISRTNWPQVAPCCAPRPCQNSIRPLMPASLGLSRCRCGIDLIGILENTGPWLVLPKAMPFYPLFKWNS